MRQERARARLGEVEHRTLVRKARFQKKRPLAGLGDESYAVRQRDKPVQERTVELLRKKRMVRHAWSVQILPPEQATSANIITTNVAIKNKVSARFFICNSSFLCRSIVTSLNVLKVCVFSLFCQYFTHDPCKLLTQKTDVFGHSVDFVDYIPYPPKHTLTRRHVAYGFCVYTLFGI